MKILERLKQIEARKKEIRNILGEDKGADLDSLEKELRELNSEKDQLEKRQALLDEARGIETGEVEVRSKGTVNEILDPKSSEKREKKVDREERGKNLKEKRAITVGTGDIVLPKHSSNTINPTFNQVSSLIDGVKHVPLVGGESYTSAYEKGHGEGGYTEEGATANEVSIEFGYAEINKTKITAYSEETEEVLKLPNIDYDNIIETGVGKSLRRKISKEILIGDGTAGHLVGIFSVKAEAIDVATDIEIEAIDDKTLDEIIFSFGGDEDVEDQAVLILNKNDLKSFATLRKTDGSKVYDVKTNGNTGTIDNIPYIINSACKSVAKAGTGEYCMAYGPLSNYELATFSETEIKRSEDSKFKEGMIAHKGVTFVGGNVSAYNGFLRVKKKAVL